jgi:uncharacterized SAM-binding protein YcdF (DUF218 family)
MKQADVLVVLGAALAADGGLGPALAERVEAGVRAFKAGVAPRLLMTGALEATAMKRRAMELGVPGEAIVVEHTARTTRENALFSSALLRKEGLGRVLIVTQRYHRRRAVAAFRRVGIDAAPLEFRSRRERPKQLLRELAARLVYRLRGWV